ncbi:MAG TPA: kynureninase [Chitinophagaceae bacterium]|nr:kynureninase [Chitinophagaceae bacterium]
MRFKASLEFAEKMDAKDPLKKFRKQFHFPLHKGKKAIYFCGNSLGLQPKQTAKAFKQELKDWKTLAIGGYSGARNPWLFYHENFKKPLSKMMGCRQHEVTVMNALTVNLHLLLLSFYRPAGDRYKIIMEAGAFPSDQYAAETQVTFYGYHPGDAIIEIAPRKGEKILRTEDIIKTIENNKDAVALALLGGINYYTGQLYNIKAITEAAHNAGAMAGYDLAHVAGNVPMELHKWDADFAVWCSYKYLNAGPGAASGVYINARHAHNKNKGRLGGWWGNAEKTRFKMEKGFKPKPNVDGWQVSTAQVFNMVALKASLEMFEKAGIKTLRKKSVQLSGYLEFLLQQIHNIKFEIITPADPLQRGAQLSLYFKGKGKEIHQELTNKGIIVDYREPGVIRVAPAPLYNSFKEVYKFYEIVKAFE